jgi:hypothetical protein
MTLAPTILSKWRDGGDHAATIRAASDRRRLIINDIYT